MLNKYFTISSRWRIQDSLIPPWTFRLLYHMSFLSLRVLLQTNLFSHFVLTCKIDKWTKRMHLRTNVRCNYVSISFSQYICALYKTRICPLILMNISRLCNQYSTLPFNYRDSKLYAYSNTYPWPKLPRLGVVPAFYWIKVCPYLVGERKTKIKTDKLKMSIIRPNKVM